MPTKGSTSPQDSTGREGPLTPAAPVAVDSESNAVRGADPPEEDGMCGPHTATPGRRQSAVKPS